MKRWVEEEPGPGNRKPMMKEEGKETVTKRCRKKTAKTGVSKWNEVREREKRETRMRQRKEGKHSKVLVSSEGGRERKLVRRKGRNGREGSTSNNISLFLFLFQLCVRKPVRLFDTVSSKINENTPKSAM